MPSVSISISGATDMSDEKVIPIRRDKYEALMRDSEEFETHLLGAIHFGIEKGIPTVMMIGHLYRLMSDLDFNAISFEPEDGA